jgi:hypothetical protein
MKAKTMMRSAFGSVMVLAPHDNGGDAEFRCGEEIAQKVRSSLDLDTHSTGDGARRRNKHDACRECEDSVHTKKKAKRHGRTSWLRALFISRSMRRNVNHLEMT